MAVKPADLKNDNNNNILVIKISAKFTQQIFNQIITEKIKSNKLSYRLISQVQI